MQTKQNSQKNEITCSTWFLIEATILFTHMVNRPIPNVPFTVFSNGFYIYTLENLITIIIIINYCYNLSQFFLNKFPFHTGATSFITHIS